jgi:hypothetical protein
VTTYLHALTAQDVLDALPVDTVGVTASSQGLNTVQIDAYIERAAGQVNAQLVRHGMDPEQLDDNSSGLVRDAIITRACADALERLGAGTDQIERRLREWERLLKLLREEPQVMGAAQTAAPTARSNIDTASPTRRRWNSANYGGW